MTTTVETRNYNVIPMAGRSYKTETMALKRVDEVFSNLHNAYPGKRLFNVLSVRNTDGRIQIIIMNVDRDHFGEIAQTAAFNGFMVVN